MGHTWKGIKYNCIQCVLYHCTCPLPVKCISPRSQWEEYICPCCDKLMDDPVLTPCGHRMCYKCFVQMSRRVMWWSLQGNWLADVVAVTKFDQYIN